VIDPVLELSIRAGLAALLLGAACHKVMDFERFREAVAGYRLLPPQFTTAAAGLLVCIECALSLCLLLFFGPSTGVAVAALLLAYALAIAINLLRGRVNVDCGCTGPGGRRSELSWGLVLRNACLAALALATFLPVTQRALSWLDLVTVAATVTCAGLIYLAADLSIGHFQGARRFRARSEHP